MTLRLVTPRLVPSGTAVLERRARELASRAVAAVVTAERPFVAFQLCGRPCAVDAGVVERAVSRLSRPVSIPMADGAERMAAIIEEVPLPVVDLAAMAATAPRPAAALEATPALVVLTAAGSIAVAVDGPLDLLEDRLSATSVGGEARGMLRTKGVLSGGATVLDAAWLQEWAEKAARP